ncbi:MAG: ABC transporter ATP-binding protein [Lachnospiraceae bacterium]|nr:ABC transporter ATP-binding protein [Lachnospiraceae bacterium]MCI8874026.1 ABC transporter ATP-binding protein [Lachnospiraceae bacterium]MCI9058739.1 ABC transporter ATP-binding protein [Lachnospiraceae bacterium]GFI29806.1 putative ABC transporter ATP-binding protein [Lachnospiraceae bacterium]
MIKTILGQVKEFKKDSLITPACMILEVIMEMLIPLLMAAIIDNGVEKGDMNYIYKTGAVMMILAVLGLMAGMLGAKYGASAATGLARNLRFAMFDNIQSFSFANIDKFSTAGLVTRLTTDITNVQNAYQMILRMCVRAPISMITAMAMAFFINAKLASIYLIAVIVLGFCLFLIMGKAMRYFKQIFPKYDDMNASVQENVSAIRVVKAYVREDYENEKFTRASGNIYQMFTKAEKILTWNAPLMQIAVYGCILAISWLGAKMIVSNQLTTGQLMSLMTYCMNILMSLMMLSMIFVMVTMSAASAERIAEVINEKSTLSNPKHPVKEVPDGRITFEHVDFSYSKPLSETGNGEGGELVLRDINLEIHAGETIGIIGGTGSAKSSLVNLISRLYDVTAGSVSVGGIDVKKYDMEELRNQVSVVLQKNVLFSGTILENLRWGDKNATKEDCVRVCKMACAHEFIEQFPDQYDTHIEQGGSNVSGGQKQRLCIARALLKKPKILILDDSTSAVDTATDSRIRNAFATEIPDTTKLIIAQRVSSVQNADRIIVMDNGRVSDFGAHEELLERSEIYRDVYESQTGGGGDFDQPGGDK